MHTNTKHVRTTFVIDFYICHGGRVQHRILPCMWQIHFNHMLQTEPFLSACVITILLRSIFFLIFQSLINTIKLLNQFSISDVGNYAIFSFSNWSNIIPCSIILAKPTLALNRLVSLKKEAYTIARKTHTMCIQVYGQINLLLKALKSAFKPDYASSRYQN